MRPTLLILLLGLTGLLRAAAAPALAAPDTTALGALKMLPPTALENLALIEGYDGQPGPPRWNILVYDPNEASGVHEYVVAGGELVASRFVSQFAQTLRLQDVVGASAVKIDSDRVAKLAQEYAKANSIPASTFNYELKKEGEGTVPLWRVSCLNARGESVGLLVVTASKGVVISHEGFASDPGAVAAKPPRPEPEPRRTAEARRSTPAPRVREAEPVAGPVAAPAPAPAADDDRHRPLLQRLFGGH